MDVIAICPECRHRDHWHKNPVADTRCKVGEPVPCAAAVSGFDDGDYVFCGCTSVRP